MMVFQVHHPCWEGIVVIRCHLAKSLRATISSYTFILIIMALALDSNWNTMQQVQFYLNRFFYILCLQLRKRFTVHIVTKSNFTNSPIFNSKLTIQFFLLIPSYKNQLCFHMRYALFLQQQQFLQNLKKCNTYLCITLYLETYFENQVGIHI